jgi:hypothetical protein
MSQRPSRFAPLDPERDPARWEALLRRTRAAAGPELARRARGNELVFPFARWMRPALSLAAALVLVAAGLLALSGRESAAQSSTPGVAEAMGMPVAMTSLVEEGTRAEVLLLPDATEEP